MTSTEAFARASDPETSHHAAESVSARLRELQAAVLGYAYINPEGFNHVELNQYFSTQSSTYRTRCSELVAKGYIRDSGERETIGSGRRHVVWQITDKGVRAHERSTGQRG